MGSKVCGTWLVGLLSHSSRRKDDTCSQISCIFWRYGNDTLNVGLNLAAPGYGLEDQVVFCWQSGLLNKQSRCPSTQLVFGRCAPFECMLVYMNLVHSTGMKNCMSLNACFQS